MVNLDQKTILKNNVPIVTKSDVEFLLFSCHTHGLQLGCLRVLLCCEVIGFSFAVLLLPMMSASSASHCYVPALPNLLRSFYINAIIKIILYNLRG